MSATQLTDIQLLEAAAKAAGMLPPPAGMDCGEAGPKSKGGLVFSGGGQCIDWNPLTDDADALRLALTLHIEIDQVGDAITPDGGDGKRETFIGPADGGGQVDFAATRRAIVRAAAALA